MESKTRYTAKTMLAACEIHNALRAAGIKTEIAYSAKNAALSKTEIAYCSADKVREIAASLGFSIKIEA